MAIRTQSIAPSTRALRKPSHAFQVRHRPYQIQPFMLAPVLPGETLVNGLMQARVVSDPVKSPFVGWWYEMYIFYVKHRDMPNSQHFQNMVLQLGYDISPAQSIAKIENYHGAGSIDWADQCLRAVVPHYFRADGELYDTAMIGNLPSVRLQNETWLDSVLPDSQMIQGSSIAAGTTAGATDILMQHYMLLREQKMTSMDYEEFLTTYGVRPAQAAPDNKPELIRYVRDWNYPAMTVSQATGNSVQSLTWAIAERADKDRFFSEPGFLFGCCVARPKVYISKQVSSAAELLDGAMSWLPAMLLHRPETSLKKVLKTAGPLAGTPTEDYWVDVRDLFIHGDQFINFALTATDAGLVALPTAAMQKKYPSSADVDGLFVTPVGSNLVRADGVVSLNIKTAQVDHT